MTKVSKVYFGLSRVSSTCSGTWLLLRGRAGAAAPRPDRGCRSCSGPRAASAAPCSVTFWRRRRSRCRRPRPHRCRGRRSGVGGRPPAGRGPRPRGLEDRRLGQRGVDGDGEPHVAAELAAQGGGDPVTQPGLDDVLGEVVRHGDQGGVVEQPDELRERQERPLLHRDPVGVEDLEGRAPQLGHRRVRHSRPHPFRCPPGCIFVARPRDQYPSTWLSTGCG